MKKHFYSHIIEIDSIHTALDILDLSPEEKHELIVIVETSIHHVVVDTVLSELPEEDKQAFLAHLAKDQHEDIWNLLQERSHHIEEKIKKEVEKLKKNYHEDITEAHKKKK